MYTRELHSQASLLHKKRWDEKTVGPSTDSPFQNYSLPQFPFSLSRLHHHSTLESILSCSQYHFLERQLTPAHSFSFPPVIIISLSFNSSGTKAAGTELRDGEDKRIRKERLQWKQVKCEQKKKPRWKSEKKVLSIFSSLSSNFRIEVLSSVTRSLETIDSLTFSILLCQMSLLNLIACFSLLQRERESIELRRKK